jgi:phage tail sheath protein FI
MSGHGSNVSEVPTGVVPPVRVTPGLAVYVGTAPVGSGGDPASVNKPELLFNLAAAVAKFGPVTPSSEWGDWTLHEAIKAHFSAYGVGPIVCINVLDPSNNAHKGALVTEPLVLDDDGQAIVEVYGTDGPLYGVIGSTVVVKVAGVTKVLGTDYTVSFDATGRCVIARVESGSIADGAHITVSASYLNPAAIAAADIIGGYSAGAYTGIEVVEQVYPKTRLVPGLLLAPTWSETPTVAAALKTKARLINGCFRAHAFVDLSTDPGEIASPEDAPAWKSDNGYDKVDMTPCWPLVKNGDDVYHGATVLACVANLTDAAFDGIPYASPSNKDIVGTATVLDDGTEMFLGRDQANALNAQGIVTFLNGLNGWKTWGNRTGGYPGTTDPKDSFIAIRRMFNWFAATTILTTDRDVDQPGNKRLIDSVKGTMGTLINSLVAVGALVAGKIEFRKDENPVTDLADGKIVWHVTLTPPSPGEDLDFLVEYDPSALSALFT